MYESLTIPLEENPLLTKHMSPHEKHPIHVETIETITHWFENHTKIYFKNLKDSGRRITSFSSNQLYSSFRLTNPETKVSKKIFIQVQKQLHILKNKHELYDLFSCHKCFELPKLERLFNNMKDSPEKIHLQAKILKIQNHRLIADTQWKAFHQQCKDLSPNSCLVLQDFGKLFTQKGKACIHVFVIFYRVEENVVWRYIDLFDNDEHGKSDFEFLEASWTTLFSIGVFSSFRYIHIWMDGGAGDFYNTTALCFYSKFKSVYSIECEANFYEAYHGHSRCDGHIGNGKKKVKKLLQLLDQSFNNEFVFSIFSSLKDTTGYTIDFSHASQVRAQTLIDIKSFKQFKFRDSCVIECFMFSGAQVYERVVQVFYKYESQKNFILPNNNINNINNINNDKRVASEELQDDRSFKKAKHVNQIMVTNGEFFLEDTRINLGDHLEALYDDKEWYLGEVVGFTQKRVKLHFPDDNTYSAYSTNLRFPK